MIKSVKYIFFISFFLNAICEIYCQPISIDSLKKLLYKPSVDTNRKLLMEPEKFAKKESIDTIVVFYKKREAKVIRYISDYYKRKVQVLDEKNNLLEENYFDSINVSSVERDNEGNMVSTYSYINGIKTAVRYYATGIIEDIWIYDEENNHIISQTIFDSSGRINVSTQYLEKDSIIQWNNYYTETGKKTHESYLGNKTMPWLSWYPDGSLMIEAIGFGILPNSYVGKYREFFPNGSLKHEAFYDEKNPNFRVGTWKWWDEKGNLTRQEFYKNNELIDKKEFLPEVKKKEK